MKKINFLMISSIFIIVFYFIYLVVYKTQQTEAPSLEPSVKFFALLPLSENFSMLANLEQALQEDFFQLTLRNSASTISFSDCDQNIILLFQGATSFFVARSKPERGTDDFYPDFWLNILSFHDEKIAQEAFEHIETALNTHYLCNGKCPIQVIRKDKQIFYLTTRAEMFRGYINQYADFIMQQ